MIIASSIAYFHFYCTTLDGFVNQCFHDTLFTNAGVAELEYATALGAVSRKGLWVRLPPPAPKLTFFMPRGTFQNFSLKFIDIMVCFVVFRVLTRVLASVRYRKVFFA